MTVNMHQLTMLVVCSLADKWTLVISPVRFASPLLRKLHPGLSLKTIDSNAAAAFRSARKKHVQLLASASSGPN